MPCRAVSRIHCQSNQKRYESSFGLFLSELTSSRIAEALVKLPGLSFAMNACEEHKLDMDRSIRVLVDAAPSVCTHPIDGVWA